MYADERYLWVVGAADRVALDRKTGRRREAVDTVTRLLSGRWSERFGAAVRAPAHQRVQAFSELLRDTDDAALFRTLAYSPRLSVSRIGADIKNDRSWATVVDLYEACWATAERGEFPGIPARGQRTGAAYLARTRYLLLSWPFYAEPEERPKKSDWANVGDHGEVMVRARQARDDWLAELDRINDYPLLASEIDVERDIRRLAYQALDPEVLSVQAPAEPLPTLADRVAWRHCVRRHLLPRFALAASGRSAWRLMSPWARSASITATALFSVAVLLVAWGLSGLGLSGWQPIDPYAIATLCAGAAYVFIAVAAVREPAASWPWLLRQPAAAAVGVLGLTAMDNSWWGFGGVTSTLVESWYGWAAVATLLVTGSGYLLLEAVNHGVSGPWRLARRTGVVLGLGLVHALMVGVITLRWLFPGIAEEGIALAGWWDPDLATVKTVSAPLLVALTTAWSFASGVFLQSLWQDQPITAPLSHVEWRDNR